MCGINGIFAYHYAASAVDGTELRRTREAMQARGPDGSGEWFSADQRIGLGHRRLAIIDLDARADQPMRSACGRYVLVYNGEMYNYAALRRALEQQGAVFRTQSDTEVVLALYARDGVGMFGQMRGMYALALYDHERGELLLARDPHGIKPLYVADDGWTLRFASSVKALIAGGQISRAVEPAAQVGFLLYGSVPEPWTWYTDIRALPAGHYCRVAATGPQPPVEHSTLHLAFHHEAAPAPGVLEDRVRIAVTDSVDAHQVADVPVGVFLSAGIDSAAVLALSAAGGRTVDAVTLRFAEFADSADDEAPLAAQVARACGARHHVLTVDQAEFSQHWSAFIASMDQPSIDGLNTWLVSRAARAVGLKVVLSGVGGDELFAGYSSFTRIPALHRRLRLAARLPGLGMLSRKPLAACAQAFGLHPKLAGLLTLGASLPGCYLLQRGVFLPHELSHLLPADTVRTGLRRLHWQAVEAAALARVGTERSERVAWLETRCYLRNQLLRDTDWAGMAHGLEIRTPLVDARLTQALAPLLPCYRDGRGKQALAAAPLSGLPESVRRRAKTGFQTPIARWQHDLPALDSWRRHRFLQPKHTPWARRYAASLLALHSE